MMVLDVQGATIHNSMIRRIPHPTSTNFDDDILPSAKRLKSNESTDGDSRDNSEEEPAVHTPKYRLRDEIPDSEDDESDIEGGTAPLTELESALLAVKTDKEAIDEYEAMRASDLPEDLITRLNSRSWTKGQSSIYVDAFNLALETVLEDENHLFDEKEMEVFNKWRNLDYEAQYL
jgi:Fanconi-associated nuclease 1